MRFMNPPKPLEHCSLADLTPTSATAPNTAWNRRNRTMLAHGEGRLPDERHGLGWHPVAGPGSPRAAPTMSPTMRALHDRCVRGEA